MPSEDVDDESCTSGEMIHESPICRTIISKKREKGNPGHFSIRSKNSRKPQAALHPTLLFPKRENGKTPFLTHTGSDE